MWGVFSRHGYLLGTFSDFQAASLACRAWSAACAYYLGTVGMER